MGGAGRAFGTPPLFVGFLHGVDFFWTMEHLLSATCLIAGLVLAIFIVIDAWLYRREPYHSAHRAPATVVRIRGWVNVPLIAGIVAAILMSLTWRPRLVLPIVGSDLQLQNLLPSPILLAIPA